MKKLRSIWETLTIKNKIRVFTVSAFVAITVALLFDVWIVKLFVMEFNEIMEDNNKSGEIVTTINREIDAFDGYIRDTGDVDDELWDPPFHARFDRCLRSFQRSKPRNLFRACFG